jgi:hypothetical protein
MLKRANVKVSNPPFVNRRDCSAKGWVHGGGLTNYKHKLTITTHAANNKRLGTTYADT